MLKKLILIPLLLIFLYTSYAFANGAGLPPFFSINGKLSNINPLQVYGITAQSFLLPQDFAPENYVVNQPIDFVIDAKKLKTVVPQQLFTKTTYSWDFGDGTKADGLANTHAYTKIGTYILVLTINVTQVEGVPPTTFIDSFLLNILPNKHFTALPKAVIQVNGNEVVDPLKSPVLINFSKPIVFSAEKSQGEGISAYIWNLGDGQTSTKTHISHQFGSQYFDVVVLRVKDKNGFFSDAFVGLQNTAYQQKTKGSPPKESFSQYKIAGSLLIFLACLLFFIWRKKKKSSS